MVGETVEGMPVIPLICVIRKAGAIVRRRAPVADPDADEAANHPGRRGRVKVSTGPSMLKTENARPTS